VQATEEDYDKVPIEQFGLAVLRGMGWKDGDGVGRTQRYILVFVVRNFIAFECDCRCIDVRKLSELPINLVPEISKRFLKTFGDSLSPLFSTGK